MEKKLPEDKLENFLKKSFDGYSENPPADMWSRIEAGIEPAAKPLAWWGWGVFAAIWVLGIFVGQHVYFENKINRLEQELNEKTTKQPTQSPAPDADVLPIPAPEKAVEPTEKAAPQAATNQKESGNGNMGIATIADNSQPRKAIAKTKRDKAAIAETTFTGPANMLSAPLDLQAPQEQSLSDLLESVPSLPLRIAALPAPVDWLGLKQFTPARTALPSVQFQLPPPAAASHRFAAGARVMPLSVQEQIQLVRINRFPQRPGSPTKVVVNQREVTGSAFVTGVAAEYRFAGQFSLAGGADYRRTDLGSVHRAEFRFNERRMPRPGQSNQRHDFTYNLATSSGVVEVEMRVDATDPTRQVPDTEVLAFEVNTNRATAHLSFPLALQYQIGKGRLHAYIKGGAMINFLVADNFEVTSVNSLNSQFRINPGRLALARPQNLKTTTFHYLAAAGIGYDLTRSLNIRLEPTFMGSIGSQHTASYIESTNRMLGVSAGAMYRF